MDRPRPLKIVGFWKDPRGFSAYPMAWPHPAELPASDWGPERTERVLTYLRSGVTACAYMGFSSCRFEGCEAAQMLPGTRDLTDGEWLWPEGLPHYIEQHGVLLPEELAERAEQSAIPASLEVDPEVTTDDRVWVEWCVAHTEAPVADRDAASEVELQGLFNRVSTATLAMRIEPAGGRWRVTFESAHSKRVDYIPRLSIERAEAYLMQRRAPDPDRLLDAREARLLAEEILGRRSLGQRLLDAVAAAKQGVPSRPTFRGIDSGDGPPRWHVRSGTVSGEVGAQDALGLRYRLECMLSERASYLMGMHDKHRRLFGKPGR